jgi:hypothetical protein
MANQQLLDHVNQEQATGIVLAYTTTLVRFLVSPSLFLVSWLSRN